VLDNEKQREARRRQTDFLNKAKEKEQRRERGVSTGNPMVGV
jgi:hypothetical protein